jgi:hypothetical protein
MNKLKLKEYTSKHIIYQYIPEGAGEPGEVMFDMLTGGIKVMKRAQNDEFGTYGHKASSKIKQIVAEDNLLPREFIQAWY